MQCLTEKFASQCMTWAIFEATSEKTMSEPDGRSAGPCRKPRNTGCQLAMGRCMNHGRNRLFRNL